MNQQELKEWSELWSVAQSSLREGAKPRNPDGRIARIVQVLVLPSFAPNASYELFELTSGSESTYSCAVLTWDLEADSAKLRDPLERLKHPPYLEPTLSSRESPFPTNRGVELSEELASLAPPIVLRSGRLGLDGTRYELAFGDSYAGSRYQWWESAPPEWAGLESTARRFVEAVTSIIGGTD